MTIETAVGHPIYHTFPSDYGTVSTALNSGVPLALSGDSEIAKQFDSFTRSIFAASAAQPQPAPYRRSLAWAMGGPTSQPIVTAEERDALLNEPVYHAEPAAEDRPVHDERDQHAEHELDRDREDRDHERVEHVRPPGARAGRG